MSVEEMKKELNAKINSLGESQLKMVDEFIDKVNSFKGKEWDLKKYVEDILNERAEVLQKLAQ